MMPPIQQHSGNQPRGQAAIELTVALVAVVILFGGMVKIWGWMVQAMVVRQRAYDNTRVRAGTHSYTTVGGTTYVNAGTINAKGRLDYYTTPALSKSYVATPSEAGMNR